jgi:DNA-binding transcriptional MerR regulator
LISVEKALPAIPAKRYFTIGEVSELCGVKPYVLRYWEQEFSQLKPMKRRGNRRYYQHHEVLLIRRIRGLLYDQGFTISGARNRLAEAQGPQRATGPVAVPTAQAEHLPADAPWDEEPSQDTADDDGLPTRPADAENEGMPAVQTTASDAAAPAPGGAVPWGWNQVLQELLSIRELLLEE